ncbi:hypothetical protein Tco_1281243 [Tanacetum coccineum]
MLQRLELKWVRQGRVRRDQGIPDSSDGRRVGTCFILTHRRDILYDFKVVDGGLVQLGDYEAEVFQVSNDDAAVAQRRLEDKQLKEKKNKDYLVKEQEKVHLGIKVGANIILTGVPGQEGAESDVAKRRK